MALKIFSDISVWWLIPLGAIAVLISIWYYSNQKELLELSKWKKRLLIALRSSALFLLILLLLGLVLEDKEYKTEKPVFITLVDNSSSMLNYEDSTEVLSQVQSMQDKLQDAYGERFDFRTYSVDENVQKDSFDLTGNTSHLDKGFDFIYNQYYNRNVGGICFVSDGNFNIGKNPIYTAEKISLTPVFSVGVGDTTIKRDQLIKNVAVNDIAFYKNQFPIEVDIEARKMGISSGVVSLWRDGEKLESKTIDYTDGNLDFAHTTFLVDANKIGFVRYTVKVENQENESSYENNTRSFYVEVIDSRNKVLILASAPHPDVTAMRQVLDKDENIETEAILLKDWDGSLNEYALLIWHGAGRGSVTGLINEIERSKTPVLYCVTGDASKASIDQLKIGASFPARGQLDEVQANFSEAFQLFEVSDELKQRVKEWPPLKVRFGKVGLNGGNTLLSQRIGPVVKSDPILSFKAERDKKSGVLFGEGLWQWRLSEYSRYGVTTSFDELVQKTVQFLTVKRNTEPLRVNLPGRLSINEEVIINAEFYNSSFELITEPEISLLLQRDDGDEIKYTFAKKSNGYSLPLGKLQEGKYSWVASTMHDGKKYSKSGVFVVDNVSIEALSTHADHNLLRQISTKTGGDFYTLNNGDLNRLIKDVGERKDISQVTYEESTFNDLIDWKTLFVLIVVLLGMEWFIRRYSGSY